MRNAALLLAGLALGSLRASAGQTQLEVAGKLAVDVHAELLVAVDDEGHAVNWYNCGGLWGTLGDFGFDGPREQYPKLGKADGVEAVVFDGKDRLRLDIKAPESITDDDFAVEVWAQNPSVQEGECLVSWAEGMALGWGKAPADGKWHHIALVYSGGTEKLFIDGKAARESEVMRELKAGGTIVLGADAKGKRGFSGAVAAVRIHERAMSDAQVQHNFKGGVRLGADLLPNIVEKPRGILFADNSKNPNIACRTSKHFRTCWEKDRDTDGKVAARIPKQLADAEFYYEIYSKTLGMHLPIVSDKIENRGDGRKYLIEVCNNWKGGNFGGHMPHGFGYPIQGPGYLSGHELAHATQMHCMGCFPGNWWEAHANWMPEAVGRPHVQPGLSNKTSMFFMGHGRHYYHCWLIFQHLAQTPEYGPLFIARMWHRFRRGEKGKPRYHWSLFETIDPDPSTPLADEMVKMARRNITWDYAEHDRYIKANDDRDMPRYGRTLLEPAPLEPGWHRVPWDMAPQQFGYNLCPLRATARTVMVELEGYVNPERGSDWRACLVAVDKAGKPRYGAIWGQGKGTISLKPDERELYLVVVATPTKILEPVMVGDYRSFEQHHFPYKVRLEGAEPLDILIPETPNVPGSRHPNGGGFVAKTATAEPTAYIGPKAQVLERAKVLGQARIEDFAVVRGKAVVRDRAVVSGHALVERDAVIRDRAKVRDFAKASGTIRDSAKVLQHGLGGRDVSGFAVLKGQACARRSIISGTAILDGSYHKANDVDKGIWLTWSWGAGKNPGELDKELGGLYCQYLFDKPHPYLARDTYGTTHAYLVGKPALAAGPKQGSKALVLNGKDQYVELQRDAADMHAITIDVTLKWAGGPANQRIVEFAAGKDGVAFLTPSDGGGKLAFVIRRRDKEAAIGAPGLPKGRWVRVQVMLSGGTGALYVDGKAVGKNERMSLKTEDVGATACFLGRGLGGGFLNAAIDEFSIYWVALVDDVPPSPDPAAWSIEPTLIGPSKAMMRAAAGSDPRGKVEYRFEETTDGPGADDSGWQASAIYEDAGLKPGATYAYRVTMRDANGNQTMPSELGQVTWKEPHAFVQDSKGLVVMEAEHFHHNVPGASGHAWKPARKPEGFTGEGAMAALPDKGGQNDGNFSELSPRLDYTVRLTKTGRHWLWVRVHARHYTADSLHAGLDLKEEAWGRNIRTPWGPGYKWARSRPFEVRKPGVRRLCLWMREDGLVIDRLLLTTDGGYRPSEQADKDKNPTGGGPPESQRRKE
ncbi:DUF6055 domain-containing protein [Planctomycetota bacterium]